MKEAFVEVSGLRLRVGRHGEGPPLLLITGIGANLDMWAPLERLLPGRELVAFDAPGVGLSQRPSRPLRMGGLSRIVRELMDVLALERADRARLLVRRRARAGVGATGAGPGAPARALRHRARPGRDAAQANGRPDAREPGALLPPATARALDPAHRRRPHGARSRACWPSTPARASHTRRTCSATPTSSTPRPAGRACRGCAASRTPTLVVAGDDDPAVPVANARLLEARLPNARLHVIRGGGHLFLLDEPESAVGEIGAFLDEPL